MFSLCGHEEAGYLVLGRVFSRCRHEQAEYLVLGRLVLLCRHEEVFNIWCLEECFRCVDTKKLYIWCLEERFRCVNTKKLYIWCLEECFRCVNKKKLNIGAFKSVFALQTVFSPSHMKKPSKLLHLNKTILNFNKLLNLKILKLNLKTKIKISRKQKDTSQGQKMHPRVGGGWNIQFCCTSEYMPRSPSESESESFVARKENKRYSVH